MFESSHRFGAGVIARMAKDSNRPSAQQCQKLRWVCRSNGCIVFALHRILDPMQPVFDAAAMGANQSGSLLG